MQQDQNNQQNNQTGKKGPSDKFGQKQGINPGYVHPPVNDDELEFDDTGLDEIPGEYPDKEDEQEFEEPTFEQKARIADQHEHPHTGASFPKQDPATGPDGKLVSNGKVF